MAPPVIEPVPLPDPDTGTPQVVVGQPQTKRTTAPTMRAVLELLADTDEIGIVGFGQSNRVPQGDRDTEGFVAAPHLVLRPAGLDLTIHSIVSAVTGSAHGAVGTRSVVNVAEELTTNDWVNGELRLVQFDYGDSTPSSLRRGHAIVQSCLGSASATTAAGIVLNSTANTVIWANHGRAEGSLVHFTTSGSLPGALTSGLPVYVCNVTANSFQVSASPPGYGAVLSLAGGSGTHTVTARPHLLVKWSSAFQSPQASTTFSSGTPGVVNQTAHGYPAGSWVSYDTNVPSGLVAGTKYCVIPVTANTYNVSATLGGAAIAFATSGGTATATPDVMAFVSGYVHLNDRFNSYDNVQVVTPYQPIEPGDYPTGTPVVPGFTLASDVTSYADAALVLPYAWNEGIDGYGAVGTATVAGLVVTLGGGQTIENNLFAGGFIRVANSKARVVSNDTTTVTVAAWVPAAPPSGSQNYELHLGHHRNNPHHFTAGEGFLYPSGWMQPGGVLATSLGMTYSRPRARLVGNCVTRFLDEAACSTAIASCNLSCVTSTRDRIGGLVRRLVDWRSASPVVNVDGILRPGGNEVTSTLAGMCAVRLEAGYSGALGVLFLGTVVRPPRTTRSGADTLTELTCTDGGFQVGTGVANRAVGCQLLLGFDDGIVEFRRIHNQIQLLWRNTEFIARPGSPEAHAVEALRRLRASALDVERALRTAGDESRSVRRLAANAAERLDFIQTGGRSIHRFARRRPVSINLPA